ncbi:MAG: protein kinase [Planctomycetes bacterium]|nr:protein kinase [Planctomycetota bacterium]
MLDPAAGGDPMLRTMEYAEILPEPQAEIGSGSSDPMMRTMEYAEILPSSGSRPPPDDELLLPDDDELKFPDDLSFAPPPTTTPGSSRIPAPDSMGMTFDTLSPDEVAATVDSRGSYGSAGSAGSAGSSGSDGSRPSHYSSDSVGQVEAPLDNMFMSSEEEEVEAPPPEVGDVLGGYKILAAIGRGGMGVIYSAQKEGGEVLALKVLLGAAGIGADRRRQRFRREVEAMRRLEHECIVKVYDYGRHGPFDWYTMDYVKGHDFEKLLETHGLEDAEKLRVFEDICAAMAHAHERNVIHRDLKPQNVLVDARDNRGKVLDFGLAKILDQGVGMTRTGSALGTPYYMAPEQLKSAKHIDARADVFSLGVILYEITTGVRPFLGETAAEVGNKILTTEPPRPTRLKPHLHPDIDAMVVRALEKDPAHRYPDAGAFYADLLKHRKGLGVTGASGLSGAKGEARRWLVRNRVVATAVAVTTLVFTLVLVGVVVSMSKDDPKVAVNGGDDDDDDDRKTGKTRKTPRKTGKTGKTRKTPRASKTPRKTPSKTTRPRPSRTPTRKTEDPRPSKTPDVVAVATPTPEPSRRTRTPVDLARVALQPPQEKSGSGALALQDSMSPEKVQDFIRRLDARVFLPMASGDLELAKSNLEELKSDREITIHTRLLEELEHDRKTLVNLRNLVARRIEELPRALTGIRLYGSGERYDVKGVETLDGNFLRIDNGKGRFLELDPCELSMRDLRRIMLGKKGSDNASAHYALAVIGLYRRLGETELDKDLKLALETTDVESRSARNAVERRRDLIVWLGKDRPKAWLAYEDAAGEAWRELERKRRNAKIHRQELSRYLRDYGRSRAYQERRDAWQTAMVEYRPLSSLLAANSRAKAGRQLAWKFRKIELVQDFEVTPLDTKNVDRPFRAERKSGALRIENARVSLQLFDLVAHEGHLAFQARAKTPISFWLSGMRQELDPDAGWKILFKGKALKGIADTRRRKLTKTKHLLFDRADDDSQREFFFRQPSSKLTAPTKLFERLPKTIYFGAEAMSDLTILEFDFEWRKEENTALSPELRSALLARELSRREFEDSHSPLGVARGQATLRNRPDRMTGFLASDGWTAVGPRLIGKGGGTLWTARLARYGRLRFRYAASDGPGLKLSVGPSSLGRGRPTTWRLPAPVDPDPDRFREVTLYYHFAAKAMTLFVDGVRLRSEIGSRGATMRQAYFGLELMGRTSAKIEGFEVLELQPPPVD